MSRPAKTYLFDGEPLTMDQIRARVPILGRACLARHIAAGRNTVSAVLSHVPKRPKPGTNQQFTIRRCAPARKRRHGHRFSPPE